MLVEGNGEKNRDFLKKIGSNFQVAEKSLTVEFKNPWNLLAEFNSDSTTSNARQREISQKSNWRRERDSNPRCPFGACTLSRRVPSATRPSLHQTCTVANPAPFFNAKTLRRLNPALNLNRPAQPFLVIWWWGESLSSPVYRTRHIWARRSLAPPVRLAVHPLFRQYLPP